MYSVCARKSYLRLSLISLIGYVYFSLHESIVFVINQALIDPYQVQTVRPISYPSGSFANDLGE